MTSILPQRSLVVYKESCGTLNKSGSTGCPIDPPKWKKPQTHRVTTPVIPLIQWCRGHRSDSTDGKYFFILICFCASTKFNLSQHCVYTKFYFVFYHPLTSSDHCLSIWYRGSESSMTKDRYTFRMMNRTIRAKAMYFMVINFEVKNFVSAKMGDRLIICQGH